MCQIHKYSCQVHKHNLLEILIPFIPSLIPGPGPFVSIEAPPSHSWQLLELHPNYTQTTLNTLYCPRIHFLRLNCSKLHFTLLFFPA